jgi:peptidoglycan/xylan/chitin deacetylase (PgdA/CDA1 family)
LLKIVLPDNNHAERSYALKTLFEDFLGLRFTSSFGNTASSAEITLPNGNRLFFQDHFFYAFPANFSYLKRENIPSQILIAEKQHNPFLPESDLPILFGTEQLEISGSEIKCGIDIFAATFFMLTRWEEYVVLDRDEHGRFPASASLAGKTGFLNRPIINEYVEMLWNMLLHLGIKEKRKKRKFEFMVTHDVDAALLWKSAGFFLKKLAGDLIKRFDSREALFSLKSFFQTRFGGKKDPYDSFDYLMRIADQHGLQSHFYFLSGGETIFDKPLPLSTPFMQQLIHKIQADGHLIGLHPSYDALKDSDQFKKEKGQLEKATGFPVKCGRQHFLRFEAPFTWQMWEEQSMTIDSTLYYAEHPGFRCGTCYPFHVYNFLTRQQLQLKEVPLTAMEVSWITYGVVAHNQMLAEIRALLETVRKYNGTFVLLWHNSSLNTPGWRPLRPIFEKILNNR